MKKVTICTLANELSVSPSTISRALNDSPKISKARRREIKELARIRGFIRRDFAPRITNLCVLVCTTSPDEDLFSTYTDQVINGANRYCNENKLELSIFSTPLHRLNQIDTVKEFFRRSVNGVLVLNAQDDSAFIGDLEKEKLPYCSLITGNQDFPNRILTINNRALAAKGIEYLIQLGHRNIAFLSSDFHSRAYNDRMEGYSDAMKQAGLPLILAPLLQSKTGIDTGYASADKLLQVHPETTAIFAVSNDLIAGAHSVIDRKGLKVPEDISLIGCDDSLHAEYWRPPLTVVDIPNERLGYTAAAWVHQQIKGIAAPLPPKEPWMHGSLIVRKTTAPPGHSPSFSYLGRC